MQTLRNHVTLIGNMGQNAQITNCKNGNKVARFSIATNSQPTVKDGEVIKNTQWHSVFAWGNMAQFIENYGQKGKQVAIHGRLVKRTVLARDGKPRSVTEVEVKQIIGL
ncbi:MAG: single-stranded DNA-binding protein [Flavobacteriia bacterium]|nr:single-stranded DNA-binding protein [Flavobacteriia bacterium]